MTISVLIVDADEEYRNLTAKTLDSTGQYSTYTAGSASAALSLQAEAKPQIAVVDVDLPDMDGGEFIRQLHLVNKHLLIIAVVADEGKQSQEIIAAGASTILEKPYYLPELPAVIKSAVQGPARPSAPPKPKQDVPHRLDQTSGAETRHWLLDPKKASDFLTHLFNEHSARALIVLRGKTVWAKSSQLSNEQAEAASRKVFENVKGSLPKDSSIRYIHLDDLEGEFLLYTIPLRDDFLLALLYDSEKSFSVARKQAKYISQLILTQNLTDLPPLESPAHPDPAAIPSSQARDTTLPDDWIPQSPASVEDFPQLSKADITPPDPKLDELEEVVMSVPVSQELPPLPADWLPKHPTPSANLPFLESNDFEDTARIERAVTDQAYHEARYLLPFTTVLIPFKAEHKLDNALAEKVRAWIEDLCIAWGWRGDKIDIPSDYVRLTFYLSPETAPSTAIQHLASSLSERILEANPQFSDDLPSNHFWAKHYLLIAGDVLGEERINTFIQATRQDPGINPARRT